MLESIQDKGDIKVMAHDTGHIFLPAYVSTLFLRSYRSIPENWWIRKENKTGILFPKLFWPNYNSNCEKNV